MTGTSYGNRDVRTHGNERQLRDLLQSILGAELLRPSKRLWLVSPWVSDIPVLDNGTGGYQTLVLRWERASIRLSQVLIHLAERRTQVCIATRDDQNNVAFRAAMSEAEKRLPGRIQFRISNVLHEKGLLGDGYYLKGSFNFTHYGITINEEIATYSTDSETVAEAQVAFGTRWEIGDL